MHQKLVPDPFLILVNNPKQLLHAKNSFENKIFWKRIIKKALKNLTLFFLSNSVPFNGKNYQKQKGHGTSQLLLFRLQNKFRKIPLLVIYYVTKFDDVIKSGFWIIRKNYICKFMQANSWHHNLFHYHLFFSAWQVWKGREKITKIWISRERKELFRWNKKHFSKFWRAIIWCKNKNLIKNGGLKL